MVERRHDYLTPYAHCPSGARGVSFDKAKQKWVVKIQKDGRRKFIGAFDNFEDATAIHHQIVADWSQFDTICDALSKNKDYNASFATNTSGVRGVSYSKFHKKWEAKVQHNGTRTRIGYYDRFEDAVAARASFIKSRKLIT
jgi:hypothetical protein